MGNSEAIRESILDSYAKAYNLSPALRKELHHLSLGWPLRFTSERTGLGIDSIRARRKKIYKITGSRGADDVIQQLLTIAIRRLASE